MKIQILDAEVKCRAYAEGSLNSQNKITKYYSWGIRWSNTKTLQQVPDHIKWTSAFITCAKTCFSVVVAAAGSVQRWPSASHQRLFQESRLQTGRVLDERTESCHSALWRKPTSFHLIMWKQNRRKSTKQNRNNWFKTLELVLNQLFLFC